MNSLPLMVGLLNPDRNFKKAVENLLIQYTDNLPKRLGGVTLVVCGSSASHFYTKHRFPRKLEILSDKTLPAAPELSLDYLIGGKQHSLTIDDDVQWKSAIIHPDVIEDAIMFGKMDTVTIKVMQPLDIAIMRVGNLMGDRIEDIRRLAEWNLIDKASFLKRATEAMSHNAVECSRVNSSINYMISLIESVRMSNLYNRPKSDKDGAVVVG